MSDAPVVVITGAGSGIGQGLARRFRADGFVVAGCDLERGVSGAEEVCDLAMACDVSAAGDNEAFIAAVIERFGRVDAAIANAGLARRATIADADWSDIEDVVRVNLFGVLHTLRAALGPMTAAGRGRLVALVSRNAEVCPPGLVGYNASKAGVIASLRTLAHELREIDADILVNGLIPGPTRTEMNPGGDRSHDHCYPTARMLATLPADGPSGQTFFDEEAYPIWSRFSD